MEMVLDSPSPGSPNLMTFDHATAEIPILLDGTVRWVTGLTKRTTCDDVIYALLYQDGNHEGETTENYAIFERWRDVQRPLQARTKIMKIWKAWGVEQNNVELSLRRLQDYSYVSGESYRTSRRHKRNRHKSRHGNDCGCRPGAHRNCYSTGKLRSLESLVKLVIAQERKLQDLGERIEKTDDKIDNLETRRHFSRVKQNGDDYVQSAYLDSLSEDSMDELFGNVKSEHIEAYLEYCERIIKLEDKLSGENSKVRDLTKQLQESLARSDCVGKGLSSLSDLDLSLPLSQQLEQVQVEMNRLVSAGMMQKYQEDSIKRELQQCDKQVEVKRQLIRSLKRDLDSLQVPLDSPNVDQRQDESAEDDMDDRVSIIQVYDSPPKSRNKSVTFDDRLNHMHVIGTSRESLMERLGGSDRNGDSSTNHQIPPYVNDSSYRRRPHYTPPQQKVTSILKNKEQYSYKANSQPPVNTRVGPDTGSLSPSDTSPGSELDRLTNAHDSGRYHLPSGMYTFANDGHYSLLDSSNKQYKDEDSNSDTGLSSMHSDESPGLETLV
ncbi:ras association domain-containing protein 10-like [Haliotis rubra]|uniref:ras association domain-containing protein 10-like n=1 Tax=Haliotis rubra TaxID=36100 RepID=UPI001EE50CB7|nr:ras association domain-containing protein 10-like [Haliotis rubra]XP_046561476.1 ras association domain-containing protein 10-like [Haliotis rubra]XP_046561477.1 ras association domain-containing protein 10-like [Haliotis rubra]